MVCHNTHSTILLSLSALNYMRYDLNATIFCYGLITNEWYFNCSSVTLLIEPSSYRSGEEGSIYIIRFVSMAFILVVTFTAAVVFFFFKILLKDRLSRSLNTHYHNSLRFRGWYFTVFQVCGINITYSTSWNSKILGYLTRWSTHHMRSNSLWTFEVC